MFESHFGFTAPPFQLNPDPTFYYGSKGHSNALAYLQYGVHQAEGFIVVTGEIGAGKTTLVRTLLEGLDGNKVIAAQIASTQLDATGLLQAMLAAFGVPSQPGVSSKATLISTLEAFFMTLAIRNKRALLVVDEAQNLSLEAIEELRMLSNFQLRKQALLQSFLVGQPELRDMLESQRLEQLRQRVIASCHLGPLDGDETERYIEHRLKRVGWTNRPSFDPDAFVAIHEATGGVPRRINLLCNRLLLATYLENGTVISAAQVLRIAQELRAEVGETATGLAVPRTAAAVAQAAQRPLAVLHDDETPRPVVRPNPEVHRLARRALPEGGRTTLLLVDAPASYLCACLLASALERRGTVARCVVVACGTAAQLGAAEQYAEVADLPALELHLGIESGSAAKRGADTLLRFESLLDEFRPDAVLSFGSSDEIVWCATLLARTAIPLLRIGALASAQQRSARMRLNTTLLDRMAAGVYAASVAARLSLEHAGVPAEQVFVKGSLALDAVAEADRMGSLAQALLAQHGMNQSFVLVSAAVGAGRLSAAALPAVVALLARVRGNHPMLWVLSGETLSALRAQGLMPELTRAGIAVSSMPVFSSRISLLHRAACLLTDAADELMDVALALDVPLLVLAPDGSASAGPDENARVQPLPLGATQLPLALPVAEDSVAAPASQAALDIAEHLSLWLERRAGV